MRRLVPLFTPLGNESADVHPSYNYLLDENGHFMNSPTSSFETYIEQQALWNHFCTSGGKATMQFSMSQDQIRSRVETQAQKMSLTSDEYLEVWHGSAILAVRDVESGQWTKIVTR